jgi:hypothetical protein
MHPYSAKHTTRNMAIGFSVLMAGAVILAAAGWFRVQGTSQVTAAADQSVPAFQEATAAIYSRLQSLPELERQMLANAKSPARSNLYQRRRADARHRIDELIATARSAAANDAQRGQVARLSALAAQADERYQQILTHAANRQDSTPLAVNMN